MGYPYYEPDCKGALCVVHGDVRDTNLKDRPDVHYTWLGVSCACHDDSHDVKYQCRGEVVMLPQDALLEARRILRESTSRPCCGDGANETI